MPRYVWVFVANCGGIEETTEVYLSEASANDRYEKYAKEHNIPFNEKWRDFDWSHSELTAWTSKVEVRP